MREVLFELVLTFYPKLAIKYKICDRQILQDNELDCRASTDDTIYSLDMVRVSDWFLPMISSQEFIDVMVWKKRIQWSSYTVSALRRRARVTSHATAGAVQVDINRDSLDLHCASGRLWQLK